MQAALAYLVIGVGAGAFYAMLATGVVVAFKGSGVINFAHGAMAMYVGFQFHYLRTRSRFELPWVDFLPGAKVPGNLPVTIRFGDGGPMPFLPAFVLAMATAVLLGAMVHFLVFRPLRNSPPLGKVIGSLGVMLYLQGVALLNFGPDTPNPRPVLPSGIIKNFLGLGRPMPIESLSFAALAVAIASITWVIFRYTQVGLASRAATTNEKGAVLLGYSVQRLALANWILSAVLAGLAGIFVGSITGSIDPVKFTGLIVPALGAALIGRLVSIPAAVAGGFMMGMLDSWTTTWLTLQGWWPSVLTPTAVRDALPLVVIVAVLFLRGKSLPIRGAVRERRLPLAPHPKRVWQWGMIGGGIAIVLATGLPGGFVFSGFTGTWSLALSVSLISAMLMLSYTVITGYLGQISLAQMSLAGIAAFVTSRLMSDGIASPDQPFPVSGLGLAWPLAAIGGVIVAAIVGTLVGLPAVRIRGVQLAVVTLAAAVFIQTFYLENPHLTDLHAGSNAIVRDPTFFGIELKSVSSRGTVDNPNFIIFCVVVLVLLCFAVANLRRSSTGRRFLAVRANEQAAAAGGIDVVRTKLLGFAIASAIAGVGGVMTGFQQRQVSSVGWVFMASLALLAFAYMGGITSINGAIVGGAISTGGLVGVFSEFHFEGAESYYAMLGGVGMIATAVLHPEGLAPAWQSGLQQLGRWLTTGPPEKFPKAAARLLPGMIPGAAFCVVLIWRNADEFRGWYVPLVIVVGLLGRAISVELWHAVGRRRRVPATRAAASRQELVPHEPLARREALAGRAEL
jgi:branched-chain amino acid transport system permease protein